LQKGFCALKEWSDYWLLKLDIKECNVLSLSYSNTITKYKYSASVDNMIIALERCNKVRDLGVIVDSKLSFSDHHITSHHIEETDAGLNRPLYLRNKCSAKTSKSQKLLI